MFSIHSLQEENYEDPDAGLPTVVSPQPPSVRTLPPSRRKAPSPPPVQVKHYNTIYFKLITMGFYYLK